MDKCKYHNNNTHSHPRHIWLEHGQMWVGQKLDFRKDPIQQQQQDQNNQWCYKNKLQLETLKTKHPQNAIEQVPLL